MKAEERSKLLYLDPTNQKGRNLTDNMVRSVMTLILEQLHRVVDYDSSSILLYDDDDHSLAVRAAQGFSDLQDALSVRISFNKDSPNYRAIREKRPVVIDDVDREPHWIKNASSQNVRSWIGAPLIACDEVFGILTIDSHTPAKYTAENASIVATFVNRVTTAVANAQAVARLQHAETTYTCLFEESVDLILITNYNGLILDINRTGCQILQRTKEVVVGGNLTFMAPLLKAFLDQQAKQLKAGTEASIEIEVSDADRPVLPLEIKVRQVQYKGAHAVIWVGRNISARKEVERMRQDMINMVVHDMGGPVGNLLTIIDFILTMLKNGQVIEQPEIIKLLEMSKHSSQILKNLADSLLEISWLEQAEAPLQRTMTNLSQLLQVVRDQVLPQAIAKNMTLTIQPVSESAEAWLDGNLIQRVLINLVNNALKYTPRKGHIALTTQLTKETLQFAVSDDGPGISQADQARIFDKFSRIDYSAEAPAGVGLGLAFCKLAVEAHKGAIAVESENIPGKGSIFYVIIPLSLPSHEEEDKSTWNAFIEIKHHQVSR